jgi:uncharacterized membrane protein
MPKFLEDLLKGIPYEGVLMNTSLAHGTDAHHEHEHDHSLSSHLAHVGCQYTNLIGTVILVGGVMVATINSVFLFLNTSCGTDYPAVLSFDKNRNPPSIPTIRFQLGQVIALALGVLVAADVLETLTKPSDAYSWDIIGKLCAIAVIRTLLAYMLGREIKEIEEEVEKHEKHHHEEHATHTVEVHKKKE